MFANRPAILAILVGCMLVPGITPPAEATLHFWTLKELYSNASGSVQFIELFTNLAGQEFLGPPSKVGMRFCWKKQRWKARS